MKFVGPNDLIKSFFLCKTIGFSVSRRSGDEFHQCLVELSSSVVLENLHYRGRETVTVLTGSSRGSDEGFLSVH